MTPEDEETWRRALLRFRSDKDRFFREDPESPLDPADRSSFSGLSYFEPNPGFRLASTLHRHAVPESVIMITSKGTRQLFNKVGFFELTVEGRSFHVQAYQPAERDSYNLFVPFRDATSGDETYGASRYLDMEVEHNDEYLVDFNYAYNPYCAYSDAFVCPLPPKENWLSIPIRAGEKRYH